MFLQNAVLRVSVLVHSFVVASIGTLETRLRRDEAGQATAEYALVLLGAAAVAILALKWANDTDRIGNLFDAMVDKVLKSAK